MSFIVKILSPGGGVLVIPFIKFVIACLLVTCMATFAFGVARIHMGILSFLSTGLLISIIVFEKEYNRISNANKARAINEASGISSTTTSHNSKDQQKTD
uniref:Uncharacterized protein n=1 Tax=Proboscia inermis TaxID=420281 RepID=A0A7S0CHT6_9STRA|mmetsp:Transcript_42246/g.49366  ORF Transcript_42246/g.49366 Transcript_42246/m.49366 type:complete len:100 (-) Transcript_42246:614-913(-)